MLKGTRCEAGECDLLMIGTGYFSEIILLDLAVSSTAPLRVVIAGRNVERMRWLVNAGRSRAAIYSTQVEYSYADIDFGSAENIAPLIARLRPRVVVHAASVQSPWKVDTGASDWSRLVSAAGFGITLPFHAVLASRTAGAIQLANSKSYFINTCYPDGVNQLLKAAHLPITSGVGNAGIFSALIGGRLNVKDRGRLRVLAHHQHLVQWRKPAMERSGSPVRAWLDEQEIEDISGFTDDIVLPYRELNVISGASATPVLLGLLGQFDGRAHVPGPGGLPGGYPVHVNERGVALDLPPGLSLEEAVQWNHQFEAADGVSIDAGGKVTYSERACEVLGKVDATLARGFEACDIEAAAQAMLTLRGRLGGD